MDIQNRHRRPTLAISGAGEDGDFVQLRKIREQLQEIRKKEDNDIPLPILKEETNSILKRESSVLDRKKTDKVLEDLFCAITDKDQQQVEKLFYKAKKLLPIDQIRDPTTGATVLHCAIEQDLLDFAFSIINTEKVDYIRAHYTVKLSGLEGPRTALHIATEKGNLELIEELLRQMPTGQQRLSSLRQETAVNISGQRPRLLSCLHLAAYHGHSNIVRKFINQGIDVNHVNGKKDTALLWAARWGHDETVRLLLDNKANPDIANDKGSTALYWAIPYQHPSTVSLLLQNGKANPNTKRKLGFVAPIILASAYGNVKICEMLVKHPAVDLNMRIRGGDTAIHNAAREGHADIVLMLIKNGAMYDVKDEVGDTPLLLAARNGHTKVVDFLLRYNADVRARNDEGFDIWYYAIATDGMSLLKTLIARDMSANISKRNPLCIAASMGRSDKITFILSLNLKISFTDSDGNTFLHYAAMNDQSDVIQEFHNTVSVQSKNNDGNTPLHIACSKGFSNTIATLLKCKAKADIPNSVGETALHVAAHSTKISPEAVKSLIEYTIKTHDWNSLTLKDHAGNNGLHIAAAFAKPDVIWEFRHVKINERDHDGQTPLHKAVRHKHPEVLHTMLDIFEGMKRDASINEQSYSNRETVLHLAAVAGHTKCVKRLIKLGSDISRQDVNGDTVLHCLVKACAHDERNMAQHIEVFETILQIIVRWWCIKHSLSFPEQEGDPVFTKYERAAIRFITNDVINKEGLSVLNQAFKCCVPEILKRLLMYENVTMFIGPNYTFDVTGLTPRTNNQDRTSCNGRRVEPVVDKANTDSSISGLELFIAHTSRKHAAEVLDLPPVKALEYHYTSIVAWSFALLMVVHIIYMSLFTYVGVDLCRKLREDSSQINSKDTATLIMYIVVPLEPCTITLFFIYRLIKHCLTGEKNLYGQETQKHQSRIVRFVSEYGFILVCQVYSVLTLTWVGLFTQRYTYQDYVLATAVCLGWMITISFTRGIQAIHFFYRMLINMIVRDMLRFMTVYLMVLLAFGFAFHIIFQISSAVVEDFPTPADTLFLTFNMMIGMGELFDGTFETNMSAVNRNSVYAKILYLFYIILSTIVLLNLLIAMMNDSYSMILTENKVMWRIESISKGVEIEESLPFTSVFSKMKINCGSIDNNGDSVARWHISMTAGDFDMYMEQLQRHNMAAADAVTRRMDELSMMMKYTNEKIQSLSSAIQNIDVSKKKHKRRKSSTLKQSEDTKLE